MNNRIPVAIIGTGDWGMNHVRMFSTSPACQVRYVVDANEKNLARAQRFASDAKPLADHRQLLDRRDYEAVVIATPAETHYEISRAFLAAGKHVLVEKPMTLKVEHARELCALARKSGVKLMVGHILLYHPALRYIKEYADQGNLGKLYYVYSSRVNLGVVRRNENALWSFAPHDVSAMVYLLGAFPTSGQAVGRCYLQPGVQDVVFFTLFFPNEVMAHGQVSWLDPHKIRKMTIVGDQKMAVFDDVELQEKVRIYDKGATRPQSYESYGEGVTLRQGDIFMPYVKSAEPLRMECDHFLTCISENRQPLTDGENGLTVVTVLNALEESMLKDGATVKIGS
jgi:predicted dehydrogenase